MITFADSGHRFVLFTLVAVMVCAVLAHSQKNAKYACQEEQPASLCGQTNTCGSDSTPCRIDVTRSGDSSAVKPSIPDPKNNKLFCVKSGTEVIWMTSKKNTGFMVSFGPDSPFDPDDPIRGGTKKPITRKAVTPGCYTYDAGASISGTIYGMSGGSRREMVILP